MSADSWGVCPKCAKKEENKLESLEQKLKNGYGKLPEQEYLSLLYEVEHWEDVELQETLREDFWIRTDDSGEFRIKYKCYCQICEFSFQFNHVEQLEWSTE